MEAVWRLGFPKETLPVLLGGGRRSGNRRSIGRLRSNRMVAWPVIGYEIAGGRDRGGKEIASGSGRARPGRARPPFVGRQAEQHQIEALIAAGRSPVACVVVDGDPGIGKTRLLAELAASAAEQGRTV